MDKSTTKQYDAMRALAVNDTALAYGVTPSYVRGCVNNTHKSGRSEDIKRHFNLTYNKLQDAIKKPTTA
jgi:phage portal protein BeeE